MNPDSPTVVSRLTPSGAGAIAVLAIRGPAAWSVVRELFRPASKKPLPVDLPGAGTVMFGHFGGDGLADEVVVAIKQTIPQPYLEIHAHGGQQVMEWLIELLSNRGVAAVSPSDFLRLVEPPRKADAWDALARAQTARTAAILLDQANGAMEIALKEIALLMDAGNGTAVWEGEAPAELDFSARREPRPPKLRDRAAALARIDTILSHARLGMHLTEPWNVVIAGAPNVGKSSLVNALAGYQRSVVAPVPGTTRDVVTAHLAIDGWPVILSDTAGLRDEATGLEQTGIAAARSTLAQADLILWVLDSTDAPVWPDTETLARNPLFVVNKTDQSAAWDIATVANAAFVSAQTGAGVPGLCAAISRWLVPQPPLPGAAVPFGDSVVDELRQIRGAIVAVDRKAMIFVLERWQLAQFGSLG